ncbi:MAG: phosphate ABC transporter permease PstA [Alphaproteobacteria bacterium]|nr:phosphate ABC transporter permease PstA [Alphaproteobacteria bacterium]
MSNSLAHARRLKNKISKGISFVFLGILFFFLGWIMLTLVTKGIVGFDMRVFTQMTPPPGSQGGLLNAIIGSLLMVTAATCSSTVLALFIVVYFSEYGRGSLLTPISCFMTDILLTAPSVIIGLLVYNIYVVPAGHFSAWAGVVALMIIALPVIINTTDNVFALIPHELREAAIALGTPRWKMIWKILLPLTKTGLISGIILSVARISGETAPLLFTALNNQFWSLNMNKPMASLPVVIFQYGMSPYKDWQNLAWAGALLLTLFVFTLNVFVRVLFRRKIVIR